MSLNLDELDAGRKEYDAAFAHWTANEGEVQKADYMRKKDALFFLYFHTYPALSARIRELEGQVAKLSSALAQCRDTVNPHDDKDGWDISMGEPSAVPDLVKRRFDALQGQVAALRDVLLDCVPRGLVGSAEYAKVGMMRLTVLTSATIAATHDARVRNLAIEDGIETIKELNTETFWQNGQEIVQVAFDCVIEKLEALKTAASKSEVEK